MEIDKGVQDDFLDQGIYIRTRVKLVHDGTIFVNGEWVHQWDERLKLVQQEDGVYEYEFTKE